MGKIERGIKQNREKRAQDTSRMWLMLPEDSTDGVGDKQHRLCSVSDNQKKIAVHKNAANVLFSWNPISHLFWSFDRYHLPEVGYYDLWWRRSM